MTRVLQVRLDADSTCHHVLLILLMQFASTYEMSAVSTGNTDQESQSDCPVAVSVEELMNLVSFVLWLETFPCRLLWATENQFTDRKCRQHLGTAEGQGGQSLPKWGWIY